MGTMNPWSFYDHKPLLVESVLVASACCQALRFRDWRTGARIATALSGLSWGLIGIADYIVYAFGYQMDHVVSSADRGDPR
jgi:hypothetical protein